LSWKELPCLIILIVQRSPLLFKQASLAALRQKLITTNGQLDAETALSPEQFEHVLNGIQYLQNPAASANGQEQRSAIEAIAKMVTTWPVDLRFPGLDLLRLYALYQPALLIASLADSDLEAFFRVWANLNELNTTVNKTLETNYMLAMRTYVNLFGSDAGLEYIKSHQLSIYSLLLADGAWQNFKTKNFRLAIATLFLK
jgi:phospholipase A-2-activating protein